MMITKFNKRKCLFKEIVKIPELCWRMRSTRKVQFSAFFSAAICFVIKISRMHEHKVFVSLFSIKLSTLLFGNLLCVVEQKSQPLSGCCCLFFLAPLFLLDN